MNLWSLILLPKGKLTHFILQRNRVWKYILSSAFKSRPKLFPGDEVAMFSSWLVSISTIDMLAAKEGESFTFYLSNTNHIYIISVSSRYFYFNSQIKAVTIYSYLIIAETISIKYIVIRSTKKA